MASARPGTPFTAAQPSATSRSSTAASSACAAMRSALSRTARAARMAAAAPDHRLARGEGTETERCDVGVAEHDAHRIDGHTELFRRELRHGRLEPLPLRGDAGEYGDGARRIHAHRDALVARAKGHARSGGGRLSEAGQLVVDG